MIEFNLGVQPLDSQITRLNLSETEIIKASTRQLTFKMLQKGRKGRRLTPNAQHKILEALHALKPDEHLTLKDLFNY